MTPLVRSQIAQAVAEFSKPGKEPRPWPKLLTTLLENYTHDEENIRVCCFRVCAEAPKILAEAEVDDAFRMYKSGLEDPSKLVKVAAVSAYISLFKVIPRTKYDCYNRLLIQVFSVIIAFKEISRYDKIAEVFVTIMELAEIAPTLFHYHLQLYLEFCVKMAINLEIEANTRVAALEFMVTLAEGAPNMCRNEPDFTNKLVEACLILMIEIAPEDDDGVVWSNEADFSLLEGLEHIYQAAKSFLDRLSLRLGAAAVLPCISEWMNHMVNSVGWRDRHAAVMALSTVTEGCSSLMSSRIDRILNIIVPLVNDPHPRVQWAAINALGQMCIDLKGDLQLHYTHFIIPPIISKLDISCPARIQAHAGSAIVNYTKYTNKEALEPYLDPLLVCLYHLLQSPKKLVIEQAISALAAIADSAGKAFARYYDTMMPLFITFMKHDTDREYRFIKAKSIECTSLMVKAVGREKAQPEFEELVQLYCIIQDSATKNHDPFKEYIAQAWGRLCQVFERQLHPYVAEIMPTLIESAKRGKEIVMIEDAEEKRFFKKEDGWDIYLADEKLTGIHTSLLEERAQVLNIMLLYATILPETVYPYIVKIGNEIIEPALKFFYTEGIRKASLRLIPSLIWSARNYVAIEKKITIEEARQDTRVYNLWLSFFDNVLDLLVIEPTLKVLVSTYKCVYYCIEEMYEGVLGTQHLITISKKINSTMRGMAARTIERQKKGNTDTDVAQADETEELDIELASEINKVIRIIFQYCKIEFIPHYEEEIAPIVASFICNTNNDQRCWAATVINDLIEFTGERSWIFRAMILDNYRDYLIEGSSELQQIIAHGIGVAADFGGLNYAALCIDNLESLYTIATSPDFTDMAVMRATETAIWAIGKVLRQYDDTGAIPDRQTDRYLIRWVEALPIYFDEEVALFVCEYLTELIVKNHESVTERVPIVLRTIAVALERDFLYDKRKSDHIISIIRSFVGKMVLDEVMVLISSFSPGERTAFLRAIA